MYTCRTPRDGMIWGMGACLSCQSQLEKRWQFKYCSNQCQFDYQYHRYIYDWQSKSRGGEKGILTKNISGHLKRFFIEKFGEQCSSCGWNKKHSVTGRVPVEIDHIDGDSENNSESNLRLLCPNCHALTPTFKNLNKGKGRKWRTLKRTKAVT